jgi:hypothetical protein
VEHGGPLALIAGGSGIVPLMAMIRHRAAQASPIATALLCSWRTAEDVIYRGELARLAARRDGLEVSHTLGGDMGALRTELDRLDGNAAAGILREVFAVEMTTSSCTCAACRQSSPVSALLLYGGATGAVLRCPRCEALVLCITRVRSGHVIELQGIVHVGVADGDSPA